MRQCEWCHKEIHKKQNLFCDMHCYRQWNKSYQIKKICIVCDKEYYVPSCRDKISRCCSKSCRAVLAGNAAALVNSDKAEIVSKECLQCHIIFPLFKSKEHWSKNGKTGERKFCCKACQLQYRKENLQRVIIKCQQCGKEKSVKPYQKDAKYCSKQCKWAFERTLTGEKSPSFKHGFKIYRREALKLHDYKCSHCGLTHRRLHVHHLDGNNKNNIPSNWAILCEKCHRQVHFGLIALLSVPGETYHDEKDSFHAVPDA